MLSLLPILAGSSGVAGTIDRNGTANDLNTDAAWVGGVAPGAGDVARWGSSATGNFGQGLGGNVAWEGIILGNPSGTTAVTIPDTGFTLSLGAAGIDLTGAVDNNLAINAPLFLGVSQAWNVAAGRNITTVGTVTGSSTLTINSTGTGSVTFGGTNPGFTGAIVVNAGSFSVGGINSVSVANTVSVNSGATFSRANGGSSSVNLVTVAGFNDGAGGGGTVTRGTAGGNRPIEIGGSGNYSFSGSIVDGNATNLLNVYKTGTGTQTLSGTNTYTSGTTIVNGTIRLNGNTGSLASTGALTMRGGTFHYDNTLSSGVKSQTLGALTIGGFGNSTILATKGGASDSTLSFASLGTRSTGGTVNFVIADGVNGTTNRISITGLAAGPIDRAYFYNGSNYAYNDATGFIRGINWGVDANTSTSAGAASLATIAFAQATGDITAQSTATFTGLNLVNISDFTFGSGQTVTTMGILRSGGNGQETTISGGTALRASTGSNNELVIRTDTVNDLLAIDTTIANNGANATQVTKTGDGLLTLNGANTYTGQTFVTGGVLSVSSNGNLGAEATGARINLNNGTLRATSTFGLHNGTAGTNNRPVTIVNTGTIEVTGSNALTISGSVGDQWVANDVNNYRKGSLAKTGSGTLVLSGANNYAGTTTVSAGSLLVNGSHVNAGAYLVGSGGRLGGTGSITTINGAGVTLASGASLAPGNSPGTLTLDLTGGSLDISLAVSGGNTGALEFELGAIGAGTSDLLSLTNGTFIIGNGEMEFADFDFTLLSGFGIGTYTLFETNSAISGSLGSSVSGLLGGYNGVLSISGNDLVLTVTVVPEPSTSMVLLGGIGALLAFNRGRRGSRSVQI